MVLGQTNPAEAWTRGRVAVALLLAIGTLVATLVLPWPALLLPAAAGFLSLALLNPRQIGALVNKWLWLGLALVVVLPTWLIGTPGDRTAQYAGGEIAALTAGLTMAVRVLATLSAMLLIGGCLSPTAVSRLLGRFIGRDLALACAIGVNLLPAVLEILRRTTLAMRLRGGFRRHRVANLKRLATAVGVQAVRLTEDVAEALLLAQPAPGDADDRETPPSESVT